MAVFTYTALDRAGKQQRGTIPADTKIAAMDHVIGQGLSPVTMVENAGAAGAMAHSTSTRVSGSAVEAFTRELANLLAAGLPLSRALHLLRREASSAGAK